MPQPYLPQAFGASSKLVVEIAWGANLTAAASSWTWTDVTADVRVQPGISTSLGRSDEASTSQPATCTLALTNTSGNYSVGGESANWPNVRRNTPVRVRVDPGDGGGYRVVFLGFADGFTPGWDSLTGTIPVVALSASGTLRRLAQGDAPLISPYRRAMTELSSVVAYWPFEEGRNASFVPAVRGGPDGVITGAQGVGVGEPRFGASDRFLCSAPLPDLGTASITCNVDPYPTTSSHQLRWLFEVPDDGLPNNAVLNYVWLTGGTLSRFDLVYSAFNGGLSMFIYNSNGSLNDSITDIGFNTPGTARRMSLELIQEGANVRWRLTVVAPTDTTGGFFTDTVSNRTIGRIRQVVIAPDADCKGVTFGHLTIQNTTTGFLEASGPLGAYTGEFILSTNTFGLGRMDRVAGENGVGITRYNPAGAALTNLYDQAGPQPLGTLLGILRECEDTDQGQLWDGRDPGLSYTTRRWREDGNLAFTIDAAAGELDPSFAAVDDDQRTRNRVSVENAQSITATYEDIDGPLGTKAVGIYDSSYNINNFSDVMTVHHAAWQVHLGTVTGYRYPSVTVSALATPHLMPAAVAAIPGDRIDIINLDSTLGSFPAGTVSLIIEGISQQLTAAGWTITFKCSPFSPWGCSVLAADTGDTSPFVLRGDTAGCVTNGARAAGATTLAVTTTAGPRWTTTADDYPITLSVGGIPVVATACSGTGTSQTFTIQPLPVARSSGVPVSLYDPRPIGL